MKKRLLIGVVAQECHMEMTNEVLRGIITQAFSCNCDIAVISPVIGQQYIRNKHRLCEKEIYKLILSERFDGFIYDRRFIARNNDIAEYVDELLESSNKPVMLVDGNEHPIFENTIADDSRPFEKLVTHLIEEHDYKNILCLTGPKDSTPAIERLNGYFNAMEKHGLHYDESCYIYGDFWKSSANLLGEEIISGERPMPDAIVCGNDITAAALIKKLSQGGIRVPQDVAVTGFDCTVHDYDADHSITSYKRANFQLGTECFRRLYRIITGRICKRIPNETEGLRLGQSCGCSMLPNYKTLEMRSIKKQKSLDESLLSSDMLVDITNKPVLEEMLHRIADSTFLIYKFSRFNICLTNDYMNSLNHSGDDVLTFSHKQKMCQKIVRHSSGNTVIMNESFSADDVFPEFSEKHKKPIAYYISPLHYHERFFGYAAITFGKYPLSYSLGYTYFITYACTALEKHRVRMKMQNITNSYCYDSATQLPVLKMLEQMIFQDSFKSEATLIYIEINDIKKIYSQNKFENIPDIMKTFADCLRSCLNEKEYCGLISPGSFCIVTRNRNRTNEIFNELKDKIRFSHTNEGIRCNYSFSMGECTGMLHHINDFYDMIHNSVINTVFTYTTDKKSNNNPLFEKLCRLREKMSKNPELSWNTDDICDELHISKSYLQKSYKAFFDKSIFEELIDFRIDMAKRLLTETEMSVTEISQKCGYSSYCHFTKQFKKVECISPSDYRKTGSE